MDKSWIQTTDWQTKCFGKTKRRLLSKRTSAATFIEDALLKRQKGILNRWKEYFCELLNPATAQHLETFDEQIDEEIYLTIAEARTAFNSLKTDKPLGEDDIRPEILEAHFGVRWLTRVFQVAWKTGEVPKQWQTSVLMSVKCREACDWRGTNFL